EESWITFTPGARQTAASIPVASPFYFAVWHDMVTHLHRDWSVGNYNVLVRDERSIEVDELMTELFSDVRGIEQVPLPSGGSGNLYVRTPAGRLEISAFGDGLRRWLSILLSLLRYQGSLLCVDEIDAALHPYLEPKITEQLLRLLKKRSNQIVAATHN